MGHTPGPWTIEYEDDNGAQYEDGVRIDSPDGPVAFNVIDCSAHLIAAAPEMLAVCKALASDLSLFQFTDGEYRLSEQSVNVMLQSLRQVIALATGGERNG